MTDGEKVEPRGQPRRTTLPWVALTAAVVMGAAGAFGWISGADLSDEPSDPVRGAVLYAENCAACHGANLEGQPDWQTPDANGVLPAPPHDRTGHTWHHGDGMLFAYTKLGGAETLKRMGMTGVQSGMPGFADTLTDPEIRDILGFIKSSWTEREREMQQLRTQAEGGGPFEDFR